MAPKEIYSSLNGLRGVAALAVVIGHSRPFFEQQIAPGFYLAVDLFFALSGFVVSHAYATMLAEGRVREFALVRLVRFYPLYLVGLALGFLLAITLLALESPSALAPAVVLIVLVLALMFFPSPFGGDIFPLNVPSWSLFYELVVNIGYAALFPFLSLRVVGGVATVSGLILAVVMFRTGDASHGATLDGALAGLLRAVFSFSVGVLIYRWKRLPIAPNPKWLVAIAAVIFLIPVPPVSRLWFDLACIFLVFPTVLFLAVAGDSHRNYPTFEFLGAASYALYAIHYPIIWLMRGTAEKLQLPMTPVGIALIVTLLVVGYALDRWFDRPVRSALRFCLLDAQSSGTARPPA